MFKVVTEDLYSLGLRKNPNILRYQIGKWTKLTSEHLKKGIYDYGGIWIVQTIGNARKIRDYMHKKYGRKTRIFSVLIGKVLYSNSYRLKTDKVKLLEEIL